MRGFAQEARQLAKLWLLCGAVLTSTAIAGLSAASPAHAAFAEQFEIAGPGTDGSAFGGYGQGLALSSDAKTALIGEAMKGRLFVYEHVGASWTKQAELSLESSWSRLGVSVALSGDGSTAVASWFGNGAYVFGRENGSWVLQTPEWQGLEPPGKEEGGGLYDYGNSVAISSDGNTAVVGGVCQASYREHSACAWVFRRSEKRWHRVAEIKPAGELIVKGENAVWPALLAMSANGQTIVFANEAEEGGKGGAWVFEETDGDWKEAARLHPAKAAGPGGFGASASVSRDGSTVMIGAPWDAFGGGGAFAFTRGADGWRQQGEELTPILEPSSGEFGESVTLSGDGSTAIVGGPSNVAPGIGETGAAWVFRRSGERWWPEQKIADPSLKDGDRMGRSVVLSADGTTALIAAPGHENDGAVWAFTSPATPGVELPPAPAAVPAEGQWANLGGNPARTSTVAAPQLEPPFVTAWSRTFETPAGSGPFTVEGYDGTKEEVPNQEVLGYPLLGNGLVYVVRVNSGTPRSTEIDALSQQTGQVVWTRAVSEGRPYMALDGNRLFVVDGAGQLAALDALTGSEIWTREDLSNEPIVATEGVLYYVTASVGAKTIAVDETTGRALWEKEMFNSTGGGPVVGEGRVYVMGSNGLNQKYESKPAGWAWNERTGELEWEIAPEGLGTRGSAWTTELVEHRLWTGASGGDGNEFEEWFTAGIVDSATGESSGTYDAVKGNAPIIDNGNVIELAEHWKCPETYGPPCKLTHLELTDNTPAGERLWTFEGDGELDSGPIRINGLLLVGSASGNVYAVDQTTGREIWKTKLAEGFSPESEGGTDGAGPPTGMAADADTIAVVAGGTLTLMHGASWTEHDETTNEQESVESPVTSHPNPPPIPGSETTAPSGIAGSGVADSRSSSTPANDRARISCSVWRKPRMRRLKDGAMRVTVDVRCSKEGVAIVVAGYRETRRGKRTPGIVVLGRKTASVVAGVSVVSITLRPQQTQRLGTDRKLKISVTARD